MRRALPFGLSGLLGLVSQPATHHPTFETGPVLMSGLHIQRSITPNNAHSYAVSLRQGDYLHVTVMQQGVDLVVAVFSRGWLAVDFDTPNGRTGPESIAYVAPRAGAYRLDVRPLRGESGGRYTLTVDAIRPATPSDAARARAAAAFARAERQRASGGEAALEAATHSYREAFLEWRTAGEDQAAAMTLRRLGAACFDLGRTREALAALDEALIHARRARDTAETLEALNQIGNVHRFLGEPTAAGAAHLEALGLARAVSDVRGEAQALTQLGLLHESVGDVQAALDALEQALSLWRRLGDRTWESVTLQNLGLTYNIAGRVDEAADFLNRALAVGREVGDRQGQADTLTALGWLRYWQGEPGVALALYDEALRLWDEVGDEPGQSGTLDRRGTALVALGRLDEARASYERSLRLSRRIEARLGAAHTLSNLGRLNQARGDSAAAAGCFERALSVFREAGDREAQAHALAGWARAEQRLERLDAARVHFAEARALLDAQRDRLDVPGLRMSHLATRQAVYTDSIDLLMQLHDRRPEHGFDAEAFEIHERGRARGLLEHLALDGTTRRHHAGARHRLELGLAQHDRRRLELVTAGADASAIESEDAALRALLLEHDKLERGQHAPIEPLGLAALREGVLDDDTLLVEYALTREAAFVWVVGRNRLVSRRLTPRHDLERLAERTYAALAQSREATALESARVATRQLSEALLGPICHELRARNLVVVADGLLQYVPFAALPAPACESAPGGADTLLIERHEVVGLPSASVVPLLRRPRVDHVPPRTLALFADPVFEASDERVGRAASAMAPRPAAQPTGDVERSVRDFGLHGFPRLEHSRREARAILRRLPQSDVFVGLDFAASRAAVLGADLGAYRMLHFATHGLFNEFHPELSGLVLSLVDPAGRPQDGFLRVHEIGDLDLRADLVVLSACRTALGKQVEGEGLLGMTRAFFAAGARRLVVSLWDVDDEATADLMARFYANMLRDHLRPAEALRAAQLALREEDGRHPPYYWAAFTLQGDWH